MGSKRILKGGGKLVGVGGFFEMGEDRFGTGENLKNNYMKLVEEKF